jgi:hypothetical protein
MTDGEETLVGTITTTFEFPKTDLVSDILSDGFGDTEERARWEGKTLGELCTDDQGRVFDLVYRASINDPQWITFEIEIDEDVR